MNQDNLDLSTVKISRNRLKSPGELRRLRELEIRGRIKTIQTSPLEGHLEYEDEYRGSKETSETGDQRKNQNHPDLTTGRSSRI